MDFSVSLSTIKIQPYENGFGALVTGVIFDDILTHLDDLKRAFAKYRVLVFRGANISYANLEQLNSLMGEPFIHAQQKSGGNAHFPGHPTIALISSVTGDRSSNAEFPWHADGSFDKEPIGISFMQAQSLPSAPTFTEFVDMVMVRKNMPEEVTQLLKGKKIQIDTVYKAYGPRRVGVDEPTTDDRTQWHGIPHDMLQKDEKTGECWIYLGAKSVKNSAFIVGMDRETSDAILAMIWKMVDTEGCRLMHKWENGDLVGWDNLCTMHRSPAWEETKGDIRELLRVQSIDTRNVLYV